MSILSEGASGAAGDPTPTPTAETPPAQPQTPSAGAPPTQTPPTQTPPTQTPPAEEWLPEAYRNDPAFGKFKSLDDLCKSQKHLQSLIGKRTVARPDANSSEEEWAEWYRDNGVPDDARDYDLAADKEMPQSWNDDKVLDIYRKAFQEAHISADAAKILWKCRNENLKAQAAEAEARAKSRREQEIAKFRKEWGDDYEKNFNKAFSAFGKLFPGEKIDECPLCDDPMFIRGMLRAYDAVKDDTMPDANASVASALSAIEDRISAIMNNPGYQNAHNPDHARLVAEMVDLQRRRAQVKSRIK